MSDPSADAEGWRSVLAETLRGGPLSLAVPIATATLFLIFPVLSADQYWIRQISLVAVIALAVSGLNLTFGYAGEFQLAQVFMFALGCYTTMILAIHGWAEVVPLLMIGGLAAAILGSVIALPAVRIGGLPLALTSYFLVVTIPDIVGILQHDTGGLNGLVGIPNPRLFGHALGPTGLYEVAVVTTIVWFVVYRNLVTSRYGVAFRTLRQSPLLANSVGLSTLRLKVLAYTMGAFPAGMAGCLFGFISLVVTPTSFDFTLAVAIVAASLLGGTESVYGAIVGAFALQLGPQSSLSFERYAPIAYGLFLIAAALVFRGGLSTAARHVCLRLSRMPADSSNTVSTGPARSADSEHDVSVPLDAALRPIRGEPLRLRRVFKTFGGVHALNGVSLTANPGEVTALIGSNGSGKTTLLNVICGYVKADAGDCVLDTTSLNNLPPHVIARSGVGRTFQTPIIPTGICALDVVASGRFTADHDGVMAAVLRLPHYRRSRRADRSDAFAMLQLLGLGDVAYQEATTLPLGSRRLVEVARVLCGRPRALLLDEPAAGLNLVETARLGEVLKAVARAGAVVVLIEHNIEFVARVADVIHVVHLGTVIASGAAAAVTNDAAVIASYLGSVSTTLDPVDASPDRPCRPTAVNRRRLDVTEARSGYGDLEVVRGVSLGLPPGHVEVVLGRNGAGKSTLLATLAGLIRLDAGAITLNGEDITRLSAHRRSAAGIVLVQEGKRVFRERTVWENIELGTFTRTASRRERRWQCTQVLEQFPILRARRDDRAGALSGGQQQLLALAQGVAASPAVLLLDEPSSGLAPVVALEMFRIIRELGDSGMTVLLVEQSVEHALKIADHVTVLDNGRVASSGPPSDFYDLRALRGDYFGTRSSG